MIVRNLLSKTARRPNKSEGLVPNPSGAEFEVNNWKTSEIVVEKLVPVVGIHPFPLDELLLMTGAIARFRPTMIFEWGTHIGKSARAFYEVSQAIGLDTKIHSIDLPDDVEHGEHPHQQRGTMVKGIRNVKLHQGDGVETALKIMCKSRRNNNGTGVLFFVDGDHSYDSVKRELSQILAQAPNAAILLHDTFYQSPDSKYNVGPHRAIDELLKKNEKYKRIDAKTGLPGMTLLYSA